MTARDFRWGGNGFDRFVRPDTSTIAPAEVRNDARMALRRNNSLTGGTSVT